LNGTIVQTFERINDTGDRVTVVRTYIWAGGENEPEEQAIKDAYKAAVLEVKQVWGEPEYEGFGPRHGYGSKYDGPAFDSIGSAIQVTWWNRQHFLAAVMLTGHDADSLLVLQLAVAKVGSG
jgi:hypothetical protein